MGQPKHGRPRRAPLPAQEYGWDRRFEAMVARIGTDSIDHLDPRRRCTWIAECVDTILSKRVRGGMADVTGPSMGLRLPRAGS